jgi:hypothetical protein
LFAFPFVGEDLDEGTASTPPKEVLRSRVVPSWVQRAGGQEATRLFNDIVGPYAGFTVAP